MPDYLKTCERAARAGGQVLLDWIGRFQAREKAPSDLVTEADLASQEQIRQILLTTYPAHGFLGEEGQHTSTPQADFYWVVDPLDGTVNYVHQVPNYCVSIALCHQQQLLCGTVFDPVSGECFTAEAGSGAYLNSKPIKASRTMQVSEALVAVSFPSRIQPKSRELAEFERVIVACRAIRRTGSAALNLCYLAAGRFDAYWGGNTHAWDVAAGALILQEAGAIITNPDGSPLDINRPRFVAASTPQLHAAMMKLVGEETSA